MLGRPAALKVVLGAILVLGSFVLVGVSEAKEEDGLAIYDEGRPSPVQLQEDRPDHP
jgi:hypothetical protein